MNLQKVIKHLHRQKGKVPLYPQGMYFTPGEIRGLREIVSCLKWPEERIHEKQWDMKPVRRAIGTR